MSIPQTPKPAKLIIGLFMKEKALLTPVAKDLVDHFGPVEMVGAWFPFDHTTYYASETGTPLFRRMLAFKHLTRQDLLPETKLLTNALEERYSERGRRKVNIDPGYLVPERFVLGTGKNFIHRIYVGKGIYADLTLIYTKGGFQKLPWTYPDYADKNMLTYLERVRRRYLANCKL